MNRTYTREWYLGKVKRIKEIMPECAISADIIAGFCTEEEKDHQDTLCIMREAAYEFSYMFIYSERPGTLAAKRYEDDVDIDTKKRRLAEIIELQNKLSFESNTKDIGKHSEVLIEGDSKRSDAHWVGRNSQNKVVVFEKDPLKQFKKGDYAIVEITDYTQATLFGRIIR